VSIPSSWPPVADVQRWLSAERFAPYLRSAGGNDTAAIELYEWNVAASGAFHEVLGQLEVLLRNAMHDELTRWHRRRGRTGSWFDDPSIRLSGTAVADVAKARSRLRAPITAGRVVAELPFGFWRYLLERRYQASLWPQALQHGFPNLAGRRRREIVRNAVFDLHGLRNRIAHQEPIHSVDLARRQRQALEVAGYIDLGAHRWLGRLSRVPEVLDRRPLPRS
jgi:hypothetical protein